VSPSVVLGSAFTAVVLLAGAFQVIVFGVPWLGDKATEHETFDREITQLVVDADSSDIRVFGSDLPGVKVTRKLTWHSGKPAYSETWEGTTLTIQPLGCDGRGTCDLDYSISLPDDTKVQLETSSGDVETFGLTGDQTIGAQSGDVHVTDSSGRVTVRTSSGDVGVRAAAPTSVDVRASSGDIDVRLPDGEYDVSADANSGDVTVNVELDFGSEHRVSAHASSGDVEIGYR